MKLEDVVYKNPMNAFNKEVTEIIISNNGIEYTITPDVIGLAVRTNGNHIGTVDSCHPRKLVVR